MLWTAKCKRIRSEIGLQRIFYFKKSRWLSYLVYSQNHSRYNLCLYCRMLHLLNKIAVLGFQDGLSYSEERRIALLNQVTLMAMFGVFFKLLNEVYLSDFVGSAICLSSLCLLGITLFFQHLGKYKIARRYFTLQGVGIALTLILLFGRDFGGEFIIFALFLMVNIFFEKLKERVIFFLLVLGGYAVIQLYFSYGGEPLLKNNLSESTFYYVFTFSSIAILIMSVMFINENQAIKEKSVKLLESLKEKHEELSKNQAEMVVQNNKLETANIELEKFAYVASHDLKTPLRNVNSFLNLLDRRLPKDAKPELREYIEIASSNAQHMYNLIQDILEYSRINNGGRVEFKETNLYDLMKRVIFNLQDMMNSRGVKIQIQKLPNIVCNDSQMILLFQNLISNGIKYNESVEPTIRISSEVDGDDHLIYVTDNGIGIEQKYYDRVFEMFSRLHTQGEYDGSGIGLAICKKIVVHNGGELTLDSQNGKGTTFTIRLPKENPLAKEENKEGILQDKVA